MSGAAVLVTGASGFVGLAVVAHLLAAGRDVVGLSAAPVPAAAQPRLSRLPGRLRHHVGDIRDARMCDAACATAGLEGVIHLAAVTSGPAQEPARAVDSITVNLGGLIQVMQAAARAGIARMVLASSVAVYGPATADGALLDEDTAIDPVSLYAITKASGEQIARRLAPALGLDLRIGRLGRVFGADEYETGLRDTLSQIHAVTEHARRGLPVHLPRPCRKNWHYAPDAAAALVALLDHAGPARGLYTLGSPHVFALSDWCRLLSERHPAFAYSVGPDRPIEGGATVDLWGDRDGGLLAWDRFGTEVGVLPTHPLQAAFDDYMSGGAGR